MSRPPRPVRELRKLMVSAWGLAAIRRKNGQASLAYPHRLHRIDQRRNGQAGLVEVRLDQVEVDAEHLEDRAPLGRARRQPERLGAPQPFGDQPVSSPSVKKIASSRAAEPGASEPWTTFRPRSSA